jgi:hypothetical protein
MKTIATYSLTLILTLIFVQSTGYAQKKDENN